MSWTCRYLQRAAWIPPLLLAAAQAGAVDPFASVRENIREYMAADDLPSIAVAVAQDGKIVWEEGFGWANLEKRLPATPHTVYSLASISKPITATGLMVLVEQGLVDLDAPINAYLGEAKLIAHVGDADAATVRRVADHTAGLPLHYHFFYEDERIAPPSRDESIRRYGHLMSAPGETHEYSNFGYGLLDYVIERVSGQSYAAFMREQVFLPLGMTRTGINRLPDFGEQVAQRYTPDRTVYPFYDFDHPGGSAVFASAHDLVRFGMFHLKNHLADQRPIISDRAIDEMHRVSASKANYGIGWNHYNEAEQPTLGHGGIMGGVETRLRLLPEHDLAIVVLANANTQATDRIVEDIIRALVPAPRKLAIFAPEQGLIGLWQGAIQTYAGHTPVAIEIAADRSIKIDVGAATSQLVSMASLDEEGFLRLEKVLGQVPAKDAGRYPYTLSFKLRRRGDVLNGFVSTLSRPVPKRMDNALSYWVELKKRKPSS